MPSVPTPGVFRATATGNKPGGISLCPINLQHIRILPWRPVHGLADKAIVILCQGQAFSVGVAAFCHQSGEHQGGRRSPPSHLFWCHTLMDRPPRCGEVVRSKGAQMRRFVSAEDSTCQQRQPATNDWPPAAAQKLVPEPGLDTSLCQPIRSRQPLPLLRPVWPVMRWDSGLAPIPRSPPLRGCAYQGGPLPQEAEKSRRGATHGHDPRLFSGAGGLPAAIDLRPREHLLFRALSSVGPEAITDDHSMNRELGSESAMVTQWHLGPPASAYAALRDIYLHRRRSLFFFSRLLDRQPHSAFTSEPLSSVFVPNPSCHSFISPSGSTISTAHLHLHSQPFILTAKHF